MTLTRSVPNIRIPNVKLSDISDKILQILSPEPEPEYSEVIDGRVFNMAAPTVRHSEISANIYRKFDKFLHRKPCIVKYAPIDVFLTDTDRVQPDVVVLCDRSKLRSNGIHGAPDLIVEIKSLSTGRYDKGYKKDLYERCGVKEYWIVTPKSSEVDVYILQPDGKYAEPVNYALAEPWEYENLPDEIKEDYTNEIRTTIFGDDLIFTLEEIFEDLDGV